MDSLNGCAGLSIQRGFILKTQPFRVLIIDDDEKLMLDLANRLSGTRVATGKREIRAEVETFLVGAQDADGVTTFSESTAQRFFEVARKTYDYLIVDYSYASPRMQSVQWNEDGAAPRKQASNEHLLTLVDLKVFLLAVAGRRGTVDAAVAQRFFAQNACMLLRSFQHDREHDKLGPYAARVQAAEGVFPSLRRLDKLDGFSLIYGSDAALREELYHASPNGRRLYRNAATALTLELFNSAMLSKLASRRRSFVTIRSANKIALFAAMIAALGTFAQVLVAPLVSAAAEGSASGAWAEFAALALVTILGTYLGALLISLLAQRGLRGFFQGDEDAE